MPTDDELLRFEQERGTMPPDEYLGHEYEQDEQGRVKPETIREAGVIAALSLAAVLIGIGSTMWLVTW